MIFEGRGGGGGALEDFEKKFCNMHNNNSYGFIAQLVEHCTGIAEVTGSNPAEA